MDQATRRLLDRQEITDVLHRYCRGIDRGDADLARSVYHEDATDNHGIWSGRGIEFADWMLPQLTDCVTVHQISNISMDIQGDVAFVETYCQAISENAQAGLTVFNRYVDRFERRGGVWKIADRTIVFDVVRNGPPAGRGDMGPGATWGRRDTDDPSYKR